MRFHGLRCRGALVAMLLAATAGTASAQAGRLTGLVRDELGQPIKGAIVVAENPDVRRRSVTVTTNDKGRFGMIGLPSGVWMLSVQAPGFAAQGGPVIVRQTMNSGTPIRFALKKVVAPQSALGPVAAKDIQTALGGADTLFDAGQWDEAIVAYRAILANAPALNAINLQIAAAYRNKGEPDKAIDAYSSLLGIDPNNEKAKIGVAMTNRDKGDLAAAERTLEAAAQAPGATREVFYNLAEIKLSSNKPDEATKAYELAAVADPGWGRPVLALGRVAMNKGDKGDALKYFQKVVEIDPASPEATQARAAIEQINR